METHTSYKQDRQSSLPSVGSPRPPAVLSPLQTDSINPRPSNNQNIDIKISMAQQNQSSPTKSDSSSVSSWINLKNHGKHTVVPNSNNLPIGPGPGLAGGVPVLSHRPTPASTVYGGAQPIHIQPLTPGTPDHRFNNDIQQIPITMFPHPIPGFNLFGVRAGDGQRQQQPLHPIRHEGQDSLATSLVIGSTTLHDIPVAAFVSDTVRACCATERHALLRGHPGCLFSYRRAAELWGLAKEAQAKRNSDTAGNNSKPISGNPHPYGAIGEKIGGRGVQAQTGPPIAATTSALPTPPLGFGELASPPPPGYVRRLIGFGPTAPGEFRPMSSVRQVNHATGNRGTPPHGTTEPSDANQDSSRAPNGQYQPPSRADATEEERAAMGYSPRYQGNIWLPTNRSANIPDHLNCSLFLIHLPPDLTAHALLAAIHALGPTGRVYALHVNAPEPARGNLGCAAKVVFFTRAAAQRFFHRCQQPQQPSHPGSGGGGGGGLLVGGRRAHVTWNRIKTAERPDLVASDASRVLLISGPPAVVNPRALTAFFRTKLDFQVDEVIVLEAGGRGRGGPAAREGRGRDVLRALLRQHRRGGGSGGCHDDDDHDGDGDAGCDDAIIEYRFGSFRCQAQAAKMALARVLPQVRCYFGEDPLAPEAWRHSEYTQRRVYDSYMSGALDLESLRI